MFETIIMEKIETLNVHKFFENCAACEIRRKDMVQPNRPQMTLEYEACALHAGYLRQE